MRILSNLDQASAMEVVFDSMQIALSVKRDYCDDFDDVWRYLLPGLRIQ